SKYQENRILRRRTHRAPFRGLIPMHSFQLVLSAMLVFTSMAVGQASADGARLVVKGQGYFPVMQRLNDGRLAVVLRGGAPHLGVAGRLDIVFSNDQGGSWSPPTVVNDSPIDDRNPAFGQAADGSLVV